MECQKHNAAETCVCVFARSCFFVQTCQCPPRHSSSCMMFAELSFCNIYLTPWAAVSSLLIKRKLGFIFKLHYQLRLVCIPTLGSSTFSLLAPSSYSVPFTKFAKVLKMSTFMRNKRWHFAVNYKSINDLWNFSHFGLLEAQIFICQGFIGFKYFAVLFCYDNFFLLYIYTFYCFLSYWQT